jgi:hypothetical protein
MTWTKLGDEFTDECWRLTDEAFRLHVEGLVWSNAKHLDGRLAKDEMSRWAHHPDAAEELVSLGFWEDGGDHYQIYAHQGWQRTAESWLHQSSVNSANGRKGGRPSKPKSDSLSETESETESERDGTGRAWTRRGLKKNDHSKNGDSWGDPDPKNGDPWGDPDADRSDEVPEIYEDDLSDEERAHLEAMADRIVRDAYDQ